MLLHLAQTNEMAVASANDALTDFVLRASEGMGPGGSIDDWAGYLVEKQRTTPGEARDRYLASTDAQVGALRSVAPSARLRWVAGELAARTLASTRLSETWIHHLDVAEAFGVAAPPTDRLWHVARLAWRTLPYAFERAGAPAPSPVAFELTAPDGTTWPFGDPSQAATVVRGTAFDLCTVAGQRRPSGPSTLTADGPDAEAVLRLVRTFA
ncbi:MAG: maleylpyruvate isomerase family mycothiol-dependent enzyme [Acidimicrobiales bacterium]